MTHAKELEDFLDHFIMQSEFIRRFENTLGVEDTQGMQVLLYLSICPTSFLYTSAEMGEAAVVWAHSSTALYLNFSSETEI